MSQIDTKEIQLHNGVVIPTLGYRVDKNHGENNYERILSAMSVLDILIFLQKALQKKQLEGPSRIPKSIEANFLSQRN